MYLAQVYLIYFENSTIDIETIEGSTTPVIQMDISQIDETEMQLVITMLLSNV